MFYYLYEIRNNLNGKIYIGVHKTRDMNDGYMGSGKVIQRAFVKHGIENFTKVILETFENAEAMYAREKEVVTDDFLLREDTYNLRRGGNGGWDYINKTGENYKHKTAESFEKTKTKLKKLYENPDYRKKICERVKQEYKEGLRKPHGCVVGHEQRMRTVMAAASDSAKAKRKETFDKIKHQKGEKNSGYGTCWIYHELIGSRKCKKELLPEYIDQGWIKGRRMSKF